MKKIILALCCLIPFAGSAQDKFEISGTLSSAGTGRTVLLQYKDSQGEDAVDSTIIRNGHFVLRGNTAFGNKASISLRPVNKTTDKWKRDEQLFFLEKGHYKLSGNDSIAKASITGPQSQQEYLEYKRLNEQPMTKYMLLNQQFQVASAAKDSAEMKKIRSGFIALSTRMNALRDSFIFSHPDSYVTLDLVVHEVSPIQNPEYYKILSKRMLASTVGQMLTDRMEKAQLIAIGKTIDFTLPDEKGQPFTLSSLKGKYVLVDFWASWCGPCRSETPFLIKAYSTLKDKNLEIVSISLDESKAAWLKAVKEDKMPWIQLSDLKGVKNTVASGFGISSIPQNVLLNPEGVIIAKNLRGEDVTEQIAAFIKK